MKQCPKCQANISDTAKFCVKCGCNIKKYEEEQAQVYFCPECGTKFSGGVFCPECGFNVSNELNGQAVPSPTDAFGDGWLSDLESSSNADVATMQAQKSKEQMEKALMAFEYEAHSDGTYTIVALKDKHALNIKVPEGVVAIADHAFEGCEAFSVSLPEGLLKIGNAAFKSSVDLSSINFPQSLISIGDEAFAECETLDIKIPDSVRKVGKDVIVNTVQDKKRQAEEARKAELAKWEIGKTPTFGLYYWENDSEKLPIEWIVLASEGDKVLVISKYEIDCQRYNSLSYITWEKCAIREWLNNDFLINAFSIEEQQRIQTTKVCTQGNAEFNTDGGNDTNDKIFLLSVEEVKKYLPTCDERRCVLTPYAKEKSDNIDKHKKWWLRSPGHKQYYALTVDFRDNVNNYGTCVDNSCVGVRPAMWVEI